MIRFVILLKPLYNWKGPGWSSRHYWGSLLLWYHSVHDFYSRPPQSSRNLPEPGLAGSYPWPQHSALWPARAVENDWQHHVKILPLTARLPVCLGGLSLIRAEEKNIPNTAIRRLFKLGAVRKMSDLKMLVLNISPWSLCHCFHHISPAQASAAADANFK